MPKHQSVCAVEQVRVGWGSATEAGSCKCWDGGEGSKKKAALLGYSFFKACPGCHYTHRCSLRFVALPFFCICCSLRNAVYSLRHTLDASADAEVLREIMVSGTRGSVVSESVRGEGR